MNHEHSTTDELVSDYVSRFGHVLAFESPQARAWLRSAIEDMVERQRDATWDADGKLELRILGGDSPVDKELRRLSEEAMVSPPPTPAQEVQ